MQTGAHSARQLVREATEKLWRAGVPEPGASAEVLLAELLGVRRSELAILEKPLTEEQTMLYGAWISRRLRREPVQRILGYAYFRNLRLELDEHTFIPRSDTESVVDVALEAIDRRDSRCNVLDIGTGSGAISISIAQERPFCDVHATERSEEALAVARRNAESSGLTVTFYHADLVTGLEGLADSVDLLISNPPYVATTERNRLAPEVQAWDPEAALYSGPDNLHFYRRLFAETPPLLAPGAEVVLEVGDKQAREVMELGESTGFKPLEVRPDLAGTPRVALLRWEP